MADASYNALIGTLSYVRQSVAKIPDARRWRWLLFGQDIDTGRRFAHYAVGPVVSLGLPWLSADCSLKWLGLRFFFWHAGIPGRRRISIVSSRLKQRLDEESWWFDLLRTAVLRADPASDVLCTVTGSAGERFVARSAELLGRSVLKFEVGVSESPVSESQMIQWLSDAAMASSALGDSSTQHADADFLAEPQPREYFAPGVVWPAVVSPPMSWPVTANSDATRVACWIPSDDSPIWEQPIADRILFAASDRVQVLRARSGGAIQSLLTHHVEDPERQSALVMLASDETGHTPATDLAQSQCVVPWLVRSRCLAVDESSTGGVATGGVATDRRSDVLPTDSSAVPDSTPLSRPEEWLLHWTRPAIGPWPDQEAQEFEDELILGCRSSDHSALATLLRIVNERRLWASSETIRGGFRVVSFTEVPLIEFRKCRTYRRHRRRYDFEPWGIAIRREVLEATAAKPVTYGDDDTWQAMPDDQRPFFQNANAGDGWTQDEREWRVPDHVALDKLPVTAVAVFVDSPEAQQIVMKQSDWPVFVVPQV
ncbi:MAG TPA: hypothetical protein PK992_07535 [Planctomycetaceae bacterium]|nr:hypothetical protein [Planctomycetaceae bacterium]